MVRNRLVFTSFESTNFVPDCLWVGSDIDCRCIFLPAFKFTFFCDVSGFSFVFFK